MEKHFRSRYYQKNVIGKKCHLCGGTLELWVNYEKKDQFIGCTNFPACRYKKSKTLIDHICISHNLEWRPNIDTKVEDYMEKVKISSHGSRNEIEYLVGAAYFLDNKIKYINISSGISLYSTSIFYNDCNYQAIGFLEPYKYWDGEYAPSSLAFVPQFPFAHKYHHDYGVFSSPNRCVSPYEWIFACAIEIDIHPSHIMHPQRDRYRDSLIQYPVIRLTKTDNPFTWVPKLFSILKNIDTAQLLRGKFNLVDTR
jgi:ssDNA-binding Zn-finger/Zn-ribbon topoisomerase 1